MTALHGDGLDIPLKSGTTTLNTSTSVYLGVYLSSDYTVSPVNTTTNIAKFFGVTQDFAQSTGGSIRVRVNGMTKVQMQGTGTITAAGQYASLLGADTITAHGQFTIQDRLAGASPTQGSAFIAGQIIAVSAGTATISEMLLKPSFSTAITTTVAS